MTTDAEHAIAVRAAVDTLNTAVEAANTDGLEIEYKTVIDITGTIPLYSLEAEINRSL